jgi:hypothetical protein
VTRCHVKDCSRRRDIDQGTRDSGEKDNRLARCVQLAVDNDFKSVAQVEHEALMKDGNPTILYTKNTHE